MQIAGNSLIVVCDLAAPATDVGDTLDVRIDGNFAGTAIEIAHFTQMLGNGGAQRRVAVFSNHNGPVATEINATTNALASGSLRQMGVPLAVRARVVAVDADADASWPLTIVGIVGD